MQGEKNAFYVKGALLVSLQLRQVYFFYLFVVKGTLTTILAPRSSDLLDRLIFK